MKWWLVTGVLVMNWAALVGGTGPESKAQQAPEARWLTDYATARAAARQSGKPLFVVFR